MTISYLGSNDGSQNLSTSAAVAISATTLQPGDIVFAFVGTKVYTTTAPSSWTSLGSWTSGGYYYAVFYHVFTTADTSQSWTFSFSGSTDYVWYAFAYRSSLNQLQVVTSAVSASGAVSVGVTNPAAWVLNAAPTNSSTPPTGFVYRYGVAVNFADGSAIALAGYDTNGGVGTAGTVASSYGGMLVVFQEGATPSAPTLLTPANATYESLSGASTYTWTYNNTDGSTQGAYAFRNKIAGGSSYSYYNASTNALQTSEVWNASTTGTATLGAGILSNGNQYNWSVATQSNYGLQGPFASDFTVVGQAAPTVTLTAPTGTVTSTTAEVSWSPVFPSGAYQTGYQIWVYPYSYTILPGFTPQNGAPTTTTGWDIADLIGTAVPGFNGDGQSPAATEIDNAAGVVQVTDPTTKSTITYFADRGNNRIRCVANGAIAYDWGLTNFAANEIFTIAGNGIASFAGDNAPALQAEVNAPDYVLIDANQNLIIADTGNNRIRCVAATTNTFYGIAMTQGDIYTIAGGGTTNADGSALTVQLNAPAQMVFESSGNLIFADSGNSRVRFLAAATGTYWGIAATAGNIYTIAGTGTAGFSGDSAASTAAQVRLPKGVAFDGTNLLIADTGNNVIRCVAAVTGRYYGISMTAGDIYTIAGSLTAGYNTTPATGLSTQFSSPHHLYCIPNAFLIADTGNSAIRMYASTTAATYYGLSSVSANFVYTIAGTGTAGFSGDGGLATSAQLSAPVSVWASPSTVIVSDTGNAEMREVLSVTTTNGTSGLIWGSGLVASNAISAITGTLPNSTTCVFYVQLTETGNEVSAIASTTATVNYVGPNAPLITAVDSTDANGTPIIQVTVTGQDNFLSANDASFEGGIGTWNARLNATLSQSSAQALQGNFSLAVQSVAAGQYEVQTGLYPVSGNAPYTAFAYSLASTTTRNFYIKIDWLNSSGSVISTSASSGVTDSLTAWVLNKVTATSPSNAVNAKIWVQYGTQTAAAETHYIDSVGFYQASAVPAWSPGGFVGATTTTVTRSDGFVLRTTPTLNSTTQLAVLSDYEWTSGTSYTYTAVVDYSFGSTSLTSAPSTSSATTQSTTAWWLINPLTPTSAFAPFVTSFTMLQLEQGASHTQLGQALPTIVSSVMGGKDGQLTVQTSTAAEWTTLQNLINSRATLWLTNYLGDGLYVRVGPSPGGMSSGNGLSSKQAQLAPSLASNPVRTIQLSYQQVAQP